MPLKPPPPPAPPPPKLDGPPPLFAGLRDFWWQLSGRQARHIELQAIRCAAGWSMGDCGVAWPPPPPPPVRATVHVENQASAQLQRIGQALGRCGLSAEQFSAFMARAQNPIYTSDDNGATWVRRAAPRVTWDDDLDAIHDPATGAVHITKRKDQHAGGGKDHG